MKYKTALSGLKQLIQLQESDKYFKKKYPDIKERRQKAVDAIAKYIADCIDNPKGVKDIIDSDTDLEIVKQYWPYMLDAYVADCNGHLTHWFISDELEEFLEQTELKKLDFSAVTGEENGFPKLIPIVSNNYIIIRSHNHAYFAAFIKSMNGSIRLRIVTDDREYLTCGEKIDTAEKKDHSLSVVYNFLMYKKAFPDMVIPGVPKDVNEKPSEKVRNKSRSCTLHSMCKEKSEGSAKCPHIRKGYFRHFPENSDWYKKMRGKTIFVDATFVKGRANTVVKE